MTIYFTGKASDFDRMVHDRFGDGVAEMIEVRPHSRLSLFYLKNPNYVHPEGKTEKEMTMYELYEATEAYKHIATWNPKKREGWIFE